MVEGGGCIFSMWFFSTLSYTNLSMGPLIQCRKPMYFTLDHDALIAIRDSKNLVLRKEASFHWTTNPNLLSHLQMMMRAWWFSIIPTDRLLLWSLAAWSRCRIVRRKGFFRWGYWSRGISTHFPIYQFWSSERSATGLRKSHTCLTNWSYVRLCWRPAGWRASRQRSNCGSRRDYPSSDNNKRSDNNNPTGRKIEKLRKTSKKKIGNHIFITITRPRYACCVKRRVSSIACLKIAWRLNGVN